MNNNKYFKVAGHIFQLSFPKSGLDGISLQNYIPFASDGTDGSVLFHLTIVNDLISKESFTSIGDFDNNVASIRISKNTEGDFCFQIAHPNSELFCTMVVDSSFNKGSLNLVGNSTLRTFFLDNCLMLLYAFSTAKLDTLLIHASAVSKDQQGFIFLGKSGTGKSTHSQLWIEHIEGIQLLNDDNPVIRIIENQVYVYGSPWSGKTPCYKNDKVKLRAILKLRQAPENIITQLSTVQSYVNILSACSCMKFDENIMKSIHYTIEKLVTNVACYHLDCLPNKDAALLSFDTLK